MKDSSHISGLTGLRGVAALWVLGFHLLGVFEHWGWNLGFVRAPLEAGYLGVDLFFALSGFVIAHAYTDKLAGQSSKAAWRSFMHRRFARMYPVHIFVLVILLVGIVGSRAIGRDFAEGADYGLGNLLRHLTLTQVWLPGGSASWNAPSWSIHAEWFAYACFPLFAWRLQRVKSVAKLLTISGIGYVTLIGVVELALGGDYDRTYDFGVLRCAAGFTAGACLWRCWKLGAMHAKRIVRLARLWPVIVIGLLFVGASPALVLPALALAVPLLVVSRQSPVLSSRALQYLGRISYALYMTHHVVLTQLYARFPGHSSQSWTTSFLFLTGYLLAIGLVAHIVYSLVEEPMRKVLLSGRLRFRQRLARS
jgi:peptidoglycan/LPS O-acetylase OafA/YrhL